MNGCEYERTGIVRVHPQCSVRAGSDPCRLNAGHHGDHETVWGGGVIMRWRGDEDWSHRSPA